MKINDICDNKCKINTYIFNKNVDIKFIVQDGFLK